MIEMTASKPGGLGDTLPHFPVGLHTTISLLALSCAVKHYVAVGWCWEREKIDWKESCKFDCQLVQMIFIFCCPSVNFPKLLASGQKIKF